LFVEQASTRKPFELSASGEREFFVGNSRLSFVLDTQGRAYGVILFSGGRYSRLERIE
jgi:hypothetical protein